MQEKILIFGHGQIGSKYLKYFQDKGLAVSLAENADIRDKSAIAQIIKNYQPTVVINTAAKTNLEWCDTNRLEAFNVNVLGADNLAQVCDEQGIYFMHFSSGCIFESKDEYEINQEDSMPAPAAYYSWTKVWSEVMVKFKKSKNFKYLILRPRQPVSAEINHKNMLCKFLTFTRFIDTPNTGTVLEDLMDWTLQLIKIKPTGTLHVANEGWTTPYQIALLLRKYVLPDLPIKKISKSELDKLTPNRRVDTILNVDKLKSMGIEVIPYYERLEEIIKELADNFAKTPKDIIKRELMLTVAQSKQRTIVNDVWKKLLT